MKVPVSGKVKTRKTTMKVRVWRNKEQRWEDYGVVLSSSILTKIWLKLKGLFRNIRG